MQNKLLKVKMAFLEIKNIIPQNVKDLELQLKKKFLIWKIKLISQYTMQIGDIIEKLWRKLRDVENYSRGPVSI